MDNNQSKTRTERKFYQKKRIMVPVLVGIGFIVFGLFSAFQTSSYIATNNAHINDYTVQIIPKITGKVIKLNFENDSIVKKGEQLVFIENQKYIDNVENLEKEIKTIKDEIQDFEENIQKIENKYNQLKEENKQAKTNIDNANNDYTRYKIAYKDGLVTKKDLKNAEKNLKLAQNLYKETIEKIELSEEEKNNESSTITTKKDELENMEKNLEKAQKELENTIIIAPKDGKVINKNINLNDIVNTKNSILTILPKDCYIIAYYKNNPKNKLKVGQKATIIIHSLGIKNFTGEIVEITEAEHNSLKTKIKILDEMYEYKLKNNAKAYVKIRIN